MTLNELSPVFLSLQVALAATFLAILSGLPLAWLLARKRFPGRALLSSLLLQPLVIPPLVPGYYLLVLLGREGVIGRFLENGSGWRLVFSVEGAILAATVSALPFMIVPLWLSLERVDPRLEQAARLLGKKRLDVIRTITLPLCRSGVVTGLFMTFARAFGEFGITLLVAGNIPGQTRTLSLALHEAVLAGHNSRANWLAFIATLISVLLLWMMVRIGGTSDNRKG